MTLLKFIIQHFGKIRNVLNMQIDRAELNNFKFNVCMFKHIIDKFQFFWKLNFSLNNLHSMGN